MRVALPYLPLVLWGGVFFSLIVRKLTGRWERPHTFKWAMLLMIVAILLWTTAAVLRLYNL